jgi:hypothetical protein
VAACDRIVRKNSKSGLILQMARLATDVRRRLAVVVLPVLQPLETALARRGLEFQTSHWALQ